jgi:FAD/FMN-containing dehydrogenase
MFRLKCQALAALLGADKVSLPGSTAYHASLSSYWALQASAVHPLCFVAPQTTGQVSAIVGLLATNGSDDSSHPSQFAIRSGGHMWIPGASSSPGGVTIDLSGINSINLNADKSVVSLGVGATWDAVYAELDPFGLSVNGGRVAGVAVGGLTLGGGISYFGPQYGWTCDTVSAFEVVLADGSIVEADEKQNTDLFRGLQGGSNNFGIVTRIDLKTFNQGLLWTGTIYHPISTLDDHAKIFANMATASNYDKDASFIVAFGYSQSQGVSLIVNQLVYAKPVENPPYYKELLSLPSFMNTSSIVNMTTLSQQGAAQVPPGSRLAKRNSPSFTACI